MNDRVRPIYVVCVDAEDVALAGIDRIFIDAPWVHFEWQPPQRRNSKACAPDLTPRTRDPESSTGTKLAPQTPHVCSLPDAWCRNEMVSSAIPLV